MIRADMHRRRDLFQRWLVIKSWTVLLAITGFSLSLLGTFIVRSGLLTSVHSFASDPTRGLFILGILIFSIGPPLLLFAIQGPKIKTNGYLHLLSRVTGLVINNFLLICASIIVLIGTFYPIALEIATGMKITVGPPLQMPLYDQLLLKHHHPLLL